MNPSPWLYCPQTKPEARLLLYCFHHAGGTAQSFRSWGQTLSPAVEVRAVQLPGRADRLKEPPFREMAELIPPLARVFSESLDGDPRPFAFFGHSMGGLVAFELARHLRARSSRLPSFLSFASRAAPHVKLDSDPIYSLSDDDFLNALDRRYGASPGSELLRDPEIRAIFLPALKADMQIFDTYEPVPGAPFDLPLFVAYGNADPRINSDNVGEWSRHTTGVSEFHALPGGHFFWFTQPETILAPLRKFISSLP